MLFDNNVGAALGETVRHLSPASVVVVTDSNVARCVAPRLNLPWAVTVIRPGDANKNLDTARKVWDLFEDLHVTRKSLIINLGGGMVTDLGGFCAATFKRGVSCVNVPTTLLGAVDAASGGKTGINYNGLKNEIGCFAMPAEVIVSSCFFDTLDRSEMLSGWAEMLKHSLLDGPGSFARLIESDPSEIPADRMLELLKENIAVKQRIVAADPTEKGLRKVLNLGHTAGHAFEELWLRRSHPVSHGRAVAWGLVVAAVLSNMKCGFGSGLISTLASRVRELYGSPGIDCDKTSNCRKVTHGKNTCTSCWIPYPKRPNSATWKN